MSIYKKIILSVLTMAISSALISCQGGENQTNIELMRGMFVGPQINTQEGSLDGKMLMRVPPVGTVARGEKPYPHGKYDIPAADKLLSPKGTLTAEELISFKSVGREKYDIYCGVCHGQSGKGDGSVADKMIKRPPNLTDKMFVSYSDGRIYNVVTNGWGLMGSYLNQIPSEKDRWAVVDYVRQLQKGGK